MYRDPLFSKSRYAQLAIIMISWSLLFVGSALGQIERVWISHQSHNPDKTVINWQTAMAGPSTVNYGLTPQYGQVVRDDTHSTLHQVEIDTPARDAVYHYQVVTGGQRSADETFKSYPTGELRVALTGNWQKRPNLQAIADDNPHLLIGLGDYVWDTFGQCGIEKICSKPFEGLIDDYPTLFRSTPFLATIGNHDRQWRPRPTPPGAPAPEPVYDIEARSITRFLAQPDDEWKWYFDIPNFHVKFIAIDNAHVVDNGTHLQASHDIDANSKQFVWYKNLVDHTDTAKTAIITLYNTSNNIVKNPHGTFGHWNPHLRKNTAVISGYGLYAERTEEQGLPWYNTSLVKGRPQDMYYDKRKSFGARVSSYLLMTFNSDAGKLVIEIKNVDDGSVLDTKTLNLP